MFSILTVKQAAERAGMPTTTLRHHVNKGRIRTERLGREIMILAHDLDQFIADHQGGKYPAGVKRK